MRFLLAIQTAYTDHRSGAAHSMRIMTEWLAAAGHECRVLATARFDGLAMNADEHVAALGVPVKRLPPSKEAGGGFRPTVQFDWHGVPVTMIMTRARDPRKLDKNEARQFLRLFDVMAERFRPDVVYTYGGSPVLLEMMKHARQRGIVTVFSLRNHGYDDRRYYRHVDHVFTTSAYITELYRRRIGLRSTGLASPIAWSEVEAPAEGRSFVTFVNPSPQKGLFLFARLVQMLGDTRPDIPILVVQSAMDASYLVSLPGLDFARYPQLVASPSLTEPADIFSVTKLLLVPSAFAEPFGRIAAEAMINGVPPLVSDRGGLPETVEDGGVVLPLPDWLDEKQHRLPSAEEAQPWYDAIVRLWDDAEAYAAASARALAAAHRLYDEAALRQRYIQYFTTLRPGAALFDDPAEAQTVEG
jgi:glycosyltransferase involved in cell wall biosynthesis